LNKFRFFWTIIIVTSRCRLILAQENDWQAWVNLAIMKSGENSTNIFTFVICGKDVISYPVLNSYLSSIHSNLACTPQLTAACMPLGTALSITTQKPQSAKRHLFWCWELQWGPVACTINILWSSYDDHHEWHLYYKHSLSSIIDASKRVTTIMLQVVASLIIIFLTTLEVSFTIVIFFIIQATE
jgi:hypothetical protein